MAQKDYVACPKCNGGKIFVLNGKDVLGSKGACAPMIDNECFLQMILAEKNSPNWTSKIVFNCIECGKKCHSEESVSQHVCQKDALPENASVNNQVENTANRQLYPFDPTHFQSIPTTVQEDINARSDSCSNDSGSCDDNTIEKYGIAGYGSKPDDDLPVDYLCNVCNAKFETQKACSGHPCAAKWRRRLRGVGKATSCPSCQKDFGLPRKLRQHITFCHPLITHVCQICEKGFPKSYLLKAHVRAHTGEKPYRCEKCGRGYHTSSKLWSHKKFAHFEKTLDCENCGEKFATRQIYDNHMRIKHTKDRSLRCKICDKTFLSTSVFYQHKSTHLERKHKCSICPMAFRRLYTLRNHELIHSGQRPYPCPHCSKTFRQRGDMRKHCTTQHPGASFE